MRTLFVGILLWGTALFGPPPAAIADQVYMTPEEAIRWAFPNSKTVEKRELSLTVEQRAAIEKETSGKCFEGDKVVYCGKSGGKVDGYAIITNEIGKFEPITFIVKASPDGKVGDVAVLVYRESRGGEVQRRRFLHQLRGKKVNDPIRINSDIVNVTGATMSVRSICRGVKKVLFILNHYVIPGVS